MKIETRIQKALAADATSDAIKAAIPAVEEAATAARAEAEKTRTAALDPRLSASAAEAKRAEAERAGFQADRMEVALASLRDRLVEAEEAEALADRRARYDAAKVRGEAAAARLAAEYPEIVERLVPLLREVLEATADVIEANKERPEGADKLPIPEYAARGIEDVTSHTFPLLVTDMYVPVFEERNAAHWPPMFPATVDRINRRSIAKQVHDLRLSRITFNG